MKNSLYVVYDKVAEESSPLFATKNDGLAERMALQMLESRGMYVSEDYQLFHVGYYDNESMKVSEIQPREILFSGSDMPNNKGIISKIRSLKK